MTTASEKMIQAIEYVVKPISIGTNLGLLYLLWAMVSGAFLSSRGAVHTALYLSGRSGQEIQRSWGALRYGQWTIHELIERWREWVLKEGGWTIKYHEGWRAVSCDVVVFPRLKLQNWQSKLYRGLFGRAVKAVGLGVVVDVGYYKGARVPLLRHIVRCKNEEKCEAPLQADLIQEANKRLGEHGVLVHDAGTSIAQMRELGVDRYVIRMAKNCVVRRNYLPDDAHGNRQYGEVIRPVERMRKGQKIAATTEADGTTSFVHQGRTITVKGWFNVVLATDKVADDATSFNLWVFLTRCLTIRLFWQLMCHQSRQRLKRFSTCILTAGRLNNSHWQPSRWSACIVNSCSISTVVFAYLNWRCWRATCLRIWRRCFQHGLQVIGTSNPKRHPVGCGASWHGLGYQKITSFIPESAQKRRKPTIYPKVSAHIDEKRLQLSRN